MLSLLSTAYPVVRLTFAEASTVLGYDLWDLVSQGPEERLNATQHTQPAMLTASVAVWRVWQQQGGPEPTVMAGHSLGEYTALVCAEALAFADAVALVADRGRFMQEAVSAGQGGMAAILGLEDEQVHELCRLAAQGEVLQAVNYNSPGQIVVAGTAAAVARAVAQATLMGAKRALMLPVSVPAHCTLMHPAALRLAERLEKIPLRAPRIRVLHNVHVQSESEPTALRTALVRQIEEPVRWVQIIQKIAAEGVDKLIECGPGRVLTGLNKRIVKTTQTLPVYDAETLQQAWSQLGATPVSRAGV